MNLILLGTGGLAISLFIIFHQIATEYLDFLMSVAIFVFVCVLLILGLALGFLAVSLIVLPVLIERWRTRAKTAK